MFRRKRKKPKERIRIARTVQQSIPIDRPYKDGIFKCGGIYSKTWSFSDINYAVASDDDQMQMFLAHSAILNGLPTDATAKISIYNRKLSRSVLSELVKNDDADYSVYTKELTELLCDKMAESNNIIHEKYITVAAERKNIDEARIFFNRVGNDLTSNFSKISSRIAELGYKDRLRIFHDFFKDGDNFEFQFDLKKAVMQGASFKDYICPDSIAFKGDHIRLGDRFARVIFLK